MTSCMAGGPGCGQAATALMAAVAALGYFVLRSTDKDGGLVKRAGQAVGWTLAVVGLAGFLCGSLSHALKSCGARAGCAHRQPGTDLPPGHPPLGSAPAP